MAIFLFQHLAFKVSGNLGVSNLNQVTLWQVIVYMIHFELQHYFSCVMRCLKIHRIHSQLQRLLENLTFIVWFCAWGKNHGP